MNETKNRGSALMIVLIIVAVAALCGIGYYVWHNNKKNNSTIPPSANNQSVAQSSPTSPSPPPSTLPSQVSSNPCAYLALSKGTSEGTAGTMYWHVVITNNNAQACTLKGYPDKASVSDGTFATTVENKDLYPKVNVTLAANGGKAHVVVGLPDASNFQSPNLSCSVAAKTKLSLTYAGVPSPLTLALNDRGCIGATVTTIQPGV